MERTALVNGIDQTCPPSPPVHRCRRSPQYLHTVKCFNNRQPLHRVPTQHRIRATQLRSQATGADFFQPQYSERRTWWSFEISRVDLRLSSFCWITKLLSASPFQAKIIPASEMDGVTQSLMIAFRAHRTVPQTSLPALCSLIAHFHSRLKALWKGWQLANGSCKSESSES